MSKFKPGDVVICLFRDFGNETVGKCYTVVEGTKIGTGWFHIEKDDHLRSNTYPEHNFELAYKHKFNNKLEKLLS